MADAKTTKTACPNCNTIYKLPETFIGKTVTCKRCGERFTTKAGSIRRTFPAIGELALKYGLIEQSQLESALAHQAANATAEKEIPLETIMQEKGFLTRQQVERLHLAHKYQRATQMGKGFCKIALKQKLLTTEEVKAALTAQSEAFNTNRSILRVSDILIGTGKITPAQRDAILAVQGRQLKAKPAGNTAESARAVAPAAPAKVDSTPPTIDNAETALNDSEPAAMSPPDPAGKFEIIVSADAMSATLRPAEGLPATNTRDYIHNLLKSEGITHGLINDEQIDAYLNHDAPNGKSCLIAQGTPAVAGTNAEIRYHFETERKVGKLLVGGGIDYRERGETPFVNAGDLLAEKTPMAEGTPGINVYGEKKEAPKPADIKLRQGEGTTLSDDGLTLTAHTEGQPKMSFGGRISVISTLEISGDVDLKTGHIDFDGDISVSGAIQTGFRVKGHNLTAGEIMAADINVTGDIVVSGGIIAAAINCQGNVQAKYVKDSRISSFGNVTVSKDITDSTIEASGGCAAGTGKILSSTISAKQGILAKEIGTEISTPCRLSAGVDAHIEQEISGIEQAISRREEKKSALASQMASLDIEKQETLQQITLLAQVQDRSEIEKRNLLQQLDKLKAAAPPEAIADMEKNIKDLEGRARQAEQDLGEWFGKQDNADEKNGGFGKGYIFAERRNRRIKR